MVQKLVDVKNLTSANGANGDSAGVPMARYSADWSLERQPKGAIQFVHWHEDMETRQVVLSQFHPDANNSSSADSAGVYRSKKCAYKADCTPEEAGFVLPRNKLLGQIPATAICGNDITSSIIYTAGLVSATAGYYTPMCLLLVVCLLYFFRSIYVELVTALPLNGGTYTGLLNTTRKGVAVIAAVLSFLSYAATVVVSATSAVEYLKTLYEELHIMLGSIIVIVAFAGIMLLGMRESAILASVIFGFHMVTLLTLICTSMGFLIHTKGERLVAHYTLPGPSDPATAIALGFSNAMLGITGFESSANFVQHQATGVFAKTLRNMWLIVALVNPTISILAFSVVPIDQFYSNNVTLAVSEEAKNSLLALMAVEMREFLGGLWLQKVIIIDASVVLCGAVLTGYVGVAGLLKRMVDDDIFPRAMVATLPITGANYPIILSFAACCVTLILVTQGSMESIGGVYTVAFLSVMFLFCVSNLMLKHTRSELHREAKARWGVVILCMAALILAIVGNCVTQPIIIGYAALYFFVFLLIFYGMFSRTFLIRGFLNLTVRKQRRIKCLRKLRKSLISLLIYIEKEPVVFFSHKLDLREMNLAVQRVLSDELTRKLTVVHLYENLSDIPDSLQNNITVLDTQMYPNIQIDVILIKGRLNPGAVRLVECLLDVPPNRMFIATPSKDFPFNVADLGSVRIIMSRKDRGADEATNKTPSVHLQNMGLITNDSDPLIQSPTAVRDRAISF